MCSDVPSHYRGLIILCDVSRRSNFMLSIAFLSPDNGGTEGGAKTIEAILKAEKGSTERVRHKG